MLVSHLVDRYSFIFCGREYVFKNKILYQQPYRSGFRWFSEREIKRYKKSYRLNGLYVTDEIIKKLLTLKTFTENYDNGIQF